MADQDVEGVVENARFCGATKAKPQKTLLPLLMPTAVAYSWVFAMGHFRSVPVFFRLSSHISADRLPVK